MNYLKKIMVFLLLAATLTVGGCFNEEKGNSKVEEKVLTQPVGQASEVMANQFSKIQLSGTELMERIGSKNATAKRGANSSLLIVDNEFVNKNSTTKRAGEYAEDGFMGRGYDEVLVVSDKNERVDFDTKDGSIRYSVVYVNKDNSVEFNVDVTVNYRWDGVSWKEISSEVTENENVSMGELSKRSNGFPDPFSRELSYNASSYVKGDDVKKMQELLNKFFSEHNVSYNLGTPDGVFGPNTRGAVVKFQQCWSELTANGVFNTSTAKILVEQTSGNNNNNNTTGSIHQKIVDYLSVKSQRESTRLRAVELNGGTINNTCAYFVSETLRRNGISATQIPTGVCRVNGDTPSMSLKNKLQNMGWKTGTDLSKVKPGYLFFTYNEDHVYVFMQWYQANSTKYAYITDNQSTYYGYTDNYHVRNITELKDLNGKDKSKFGYYMYDPNGGVDPTPGTFTISTISFTTLPIVVNAAETLSVKIQDGTSTNTTRNYLLEAYAVRDGNKEYKIASGNISIASGQTEKTFTFENIKFNTAGSFFTLIRVYKSAADRTLVAERKGTSADTVTENGGILPAGYNYKIKIEVPSDRNREGNLYLYNKSLTHLHTTRALAKSASGDGVFTVGGNTPTGDYDGILQDRMGGDTVVYGYGNIIDLTGISGDAAEAYRRGRDGIWIHAGRWNYSGSASQSLMVTHGCVRIPGPDQDKMFGRTSTSRGLLGDNGVAWKAKGLVTLRTY